MQINLHYDLLKKPKAVLVTTAVVVVLYNLLFYFHPANQGWLANGEFSWGNLFKFMIIRQYLVELITTIIIFLAIRWYAQKLRLFSLSLQPKAILGYLGKFLPLFAVAFFLFNPFTQTARFVLLEDLSNSSTYLNEYLLNWRLYAVYLVPTLLTGYGILIGNLVLHYNSQLSDTQKDLDKLNRQPAYPGKLIMQDDWGEVPVDLHHVMWFEKDGRKYFAKTIKQRLRTKETISELESSLDPDKFVRINRAVIINLGHLQNYAYWENDKYVVRMNDKDHTEFVMTRNRLKKMKALLNQ